MASGFSTLATTGPFYGRQIYDIDLALHSSSACSSLWRVAAIYIVIVPSSPTVWWLQSKWTDQRRALLGLMLVLVMVAPLGDT